MKTIAILNNIVCNDINAADDYPFEMIQKIGPAVVFMPDSAIINSGKPFYLSFTDGSMEACLSLAFKVSRLGKSISKKFAHRYISHISAVINIYNKAMLLENRKKGLPIDAALCFDKSLYIGEWLPLYGQCSPNHISEEIRQYKLFAGNEIVAAVSMPDIDIENIIQIISRDNTLKTGDIILPSVSLTGVTLDHPVDLHVSSGNKTLLEIPIR